MKEPGYKLEDLLEAVPLMLTDFLTAMKWPAQLDYDDFVDMLTEAVVFDF